MDGYFLWLCRMVGIGHPEGKPYYMLCQQLHETTFRAMIPYDRNRAKDGLDLRDRYFRQTKSMPDVMVLNRECTVLEMLVALALRMEFEDRDGTCQKWFYQMISNLGLDIFTDTLMGRDPDESTAASIKAALDDFMDRRYKKDGTGHNIFITYDSLRNMKFEEIYYQMARYLEEFSE